MKNFFFILLSAAAIIFASSCARTVNDPRQDAANSENEPAIETDAGAGAEQENKAAAPEQTKEIEAPQSASADGAAPQETATKPSAGQSDEASINKIGVIARKWEFNPSVITVKLNQPVRFSITSVDVLHGFSLPEFGINRNLEPGKTEVIDFTPDKIGSFSFACSVFCGEGHGNMVGTIMVMP